MQTFSSNYWFGIHPTKLMFKHVRYTQNYFKSNLIQNYIFNKTK